MGDARAGGECLHVQGQRDRGRTELRSDTLSEGSITSSLSLLQVQPRHGLGDSSGLRCGTLCRCVGTHRWPHTSCSQPLSTEVPALTVLQTEGEPSDKPRLVSKWPYGFHIAVQYSNGTFLPSIPMPLLGEFHGIQKILFLFYNKMSKVNQDVLR